MASRPRAKSALARTTTGEMRVPEHYRRDMLVDHPGKPQWGPGRILAVDGKVLTIYFRDAPEKTVGDGVQASTRAW